MELTILQIDSVLATQGLVLFTALIVMIALVLLVLVIIGALSRGS